jgi:hypothetical protein
MIRKVNALYTEGISTTHYQQPVAVQVQGKMIYGMQQQTATSLTALAQRLSPPPKPKEPKVSWIWLFVPFIPYLGIFAMWLAPIKGRRKLLSASALALAIGYPIVVYIILQGKLQGGSITITGWLVVPVIVLLILFIGAYWYGLGEKDNEIKAHFQQQVLPPWDNAMRKWAELYYCARDDCIFDPSNGISAPPERMSTLLYT